MKIKDLNGYEIEVTDLKKAIEQTAGFKNLHHIPPLPTDKGRQEYWTDLHGKLVKLKKLT